MWGSVERTIQASHNITQPSSRRAALVSLGAPLLALARLFGRSPTSDVTAPQRDAMFGRRYRVVVVVEVIVLIGGFQALRAVRADEHANVAWVAFVVGLHFVALALVWGTAWLAAPGASLTALGGLGLALVFADSDRWVPFISGVLSGLVLSSRAFWLSSIEATRPDVLSGTFLGMTPRYSETYQGAR